MPTFSARSRRVNSARPCSCASPHAASRISTRVASRRSAILLRLGASNTIRSIRLEVGIVKRATPLPGRQQSPDSAAVIHLLSEHTRSVGSLLDRRHLSTHKHRWTNVLDRTARRTADKQERSSSEGPSSSLGYGSNGSPQLQ